MPEQAERRVRARMNALAATTGTVYAAAWGTLSRRHRGRAMGEGWSTWIVHDLEQRRACTQAAPTASLALSRVQRYATKPPDKTRTDLI